MIRQIFKQIWNRRQANGSLFVELLLVFCLLWYIVDYFFVLGYNRQLPACRDLNHTWKIEMAQLPNLHPGYQPVESDSAHLMANYERVVSRIRQYPDVEALAILNKMGSPGSGSYGSNAYYNVNDTLHSVDGQIVEFDPSTDFFRVFRYMTPDGKPVSTADFDWSDPKTVVLGDLARKKLFPEEEAIGKIITPDFPLGTYTRVVKGVVGDIKRFDYMRPQNVYYMAQRVTADRLWDFEIAVRASAAVADARFQSDFKEKMGNELRIGNFYLKELKSYNQISKETEDDFMMDGYRIRTALLLFFLLNIMLCVMGTFWYRIRVRRDEIGLRMAMGSSRTGIRRLFMMEGLCLLTLVTLPAMLLEGQIVYVELIETLGRSGSLDPAYLPDRTVLRFLLTNMLTWLILAIAILAAIWIPAGKAARMEPAEALHDE